MLHINALGTIGATVEGGALSSSNAARRERMLRELGFTSNPRVDFTHPSVDRNSDRSVRRLGLSFEAQLELVRWLRAEAMKFAEGIGLKVPAERKAHEEVAFGLDNAREVWEEIDRRAEEMIATADHAHVEAITHALAEMLARVHAEQQAIMERWPRAAANDP